MGSQNKGQAIAEATATTVDARSYDRLSYQRRHLTRWPNLCRPLQVSYCRKITIHVGLPKNRVQHIKAASLASSYLGTKYFGHWLADDCTRYILAEQFDTSPLRANATLCSSTAVRSIFQPELGTPTDRAYIDHLVVFQDYSQNSLKRKRYKILREQIKARFPETARNGYVYLRRGQTGVSRPIQGEQLIIDALTKRGFVVADIATDLLEHIIRTLLKAKIVVSLEGSHIVHSVFAIPNHSGLLVLQPADQFRAVHRDWSECLGIRFGFVVGNAGSAGYSFSLSEILRTVDLLLGNMSRA